MQDQFQNNGVAAGAAVAQLGLAEHKLFFDDLHSGVGDRDGDGDVDADHGAGVQGRSSIAARGLKARLAAMSR